MVDDEVAEEEGESSSLIQKPYTNSFICLLLFSFLI